MGYGFRKLWAFIPVIIVITVIGIPLVNIANLKRDEDKASATSSFERNYISSLEIYNEEDYLEFAKSVNEGTQYENWEVNLFSDLDFSEYETVDQIGIPEKRTRRFLGTFNGNGHKIVGIEMIRPGGYAGMFANLGGIVKNLRIEDCVFSGEICGAIASDVTGASILNCYIDAKCLGSVAGDVVGTLDGNIYNCVTSTGDFAGNITDGEIAECYRIGEEDISSLNENLYHISGAYEDVEFCGWNGSDEEILSSDKANLIEKIVGRIVVRGEELLLNGFYSANREQWCIALPAKYKEIDVALELKTTNGDIWNISRKKSEDQIEFRENGIKCTLAFLYADNIDTIYVTLDEGEALERLHADKAELAAGRMTIFDAAGELSYLPVKEFYGHGNGSWSALKRSYNVKLDSYMDLLGMGANDDFVFLAGYRDDSLMSYVTTTELVRELGFDYAPEFRLVNLYVSGEYLGVYFLTEKVEIDTNRIEIDGVYKKTKELNEAELGLLRYNEWKDEKTAAERYYYNVKRNPSDITGGYLLEADVEDYAADDSRFVSERGLQFTLKRARYTSEEQMNYIADFWQEFEDALFAENGYNDLGKHYSQYIDLESFAMQWLIYELEEESSLNSSIYFYKESDVTGDGRLHACYPWDMEHSYMLDRDTNLLWMEWFDQFHGYWNGLYAHEDFRKEVQRIWKEKYVPAIEKMISEEVAEYEGELKNLSWYQKNTEDICALETSRWALVDPWKRCDEIRGFLTKRMLVLSEKFDSIQAGE